MGRFRCCPWGAPSPWSPPRCTPPERLHPCMPPLLPPGAYTLFANVLLAQLHHHGGRRHIYYRGLTKEILGELVGWWVGGWVA